MSEKIDLRHESVHGTLGYQLNERLDLPLQSDSLNSSLPLNTYSLQFLVGFLASGGS